MENQQYIQEDEIDLMDSINVVVKRKKLILAIFLVAVVVSAVASFSMPKVYKITSTIQLGSVNELLINKEEAKEIILNKSLLLSLIKELNLDIEVASLKKDIKIDGINNTNLLKVTIDSSNPDMALKINSAILSYLISQGQSIYQERLFLVNEQLKELNARIKNAERDIDRTQNLISRRPNSKRIILLQNTLANYEINLTKLRNQKNELKFLLANAKDFKVFDAPMKSKYHIGPKMKQDVLNAGMIGLLSGVFLALLIEFRQKSKGGKAK